MSFNSLSVDNIQEMLKENQAEYCRVANLRPMLNKCIEEMGLVIIENDLYDKFGYKIQIRKD